MTNIFDEIITFFADTLSYGGDFLISWCVDIIPSIFLVLILTNSIIHLIPSRWIEKVASLSSRHIFLKYMLIPFLGSILMTNPSALTLGRFMSEKDKPSYYASASFFCHTSNGIFPHINSSELFIWLGISHGIEMLGLSVFPLAIRYLTAGLFANFICGIITDYTTAYYCRKMHITLPEIPDWNHTSQTSDRKQMKDKQTSTVDCMQKAATNNVQDFSGNNIQDFTGNDTQDSMMNNIRNSNTESSRWHRICIRAGKGGYGGPLVLMPDEKRNKLIYVVGGGMKPPLVDKIEELTGCTSVNGFKAGIPDKEVFLAVIDCGGTLRCGIYPKKQIPTVNIMPTGKSGPLARYITEDIYVSAVTEDCITLMEKKEETEEKKEINYGDTANPSKETSVYNESSMQDSDSGSKKSLSLLHRLIHWGTSLISTFGKGCSCAYKASQDSTDIIFHTLLPLMGFVSLLTAVVECSGVNSFLTEHLTFLSSDITELFLLGIIISFPLLSPILSPGAIIAQVIGTVIGSQIGNGAMAVSLALPALFAINTQAACDFIPVGLGLADAQDNTLKVGVPSVLTSRFLTSGIRILIGWIFSLGLYA